MKNCFIAISIIGAIMLLFIAVDKTPNPYEWVDSLTGFSFGYPRYIITWGGYCMLYLGSIWGIYYLLNKILDIIENYKIKRDNRGNMTR